MQTHTLVTQKQKKVKRQVTLVIDNLEGIRVSRTVDVSKADIRATVGLMTQAMLDALALTEEATQPLPVSPEGIVGHVVDDL